MAQTHHLSRSAYDRLKTEFDDLTTRGRVEIARLIEKARELGDLSENGDYHAAKEDQGRMEGRIRHLQAIIENAEIVEAAGTDTVAAGCVVEVAFDGDSDTEKFLIGSIEERHDDYEVVSPGSPLGEALMGARIGDTVSYETPSGAKLAVEIISVEA